MYEPKASKHDDIIIATHHGSAVPSVWKEGESVKVHKMRIIRHLFILALILVSCGRARTGVAPVSQPLSITNQHPRDASGDEGIDHGFEYPYELLDWFAESVNDAEPRVVENIQEHNTNKPEAIRSAFEGIQRLIEVEMDIHGNHCLPDDVHLGIYRIAQEAMTNVVKHSKTQQVTLYYSSTPQDGDLLDGNIEPGDDGGNIEVVLEVRDKCCGFELDGIPPDHFGLMNIRERAQVIGASVDISSQLDAGTQIRTVWW